LCGVDMVTKNDVVACGECGAVYSKTARIQKGRCPTCQSSDASQI